MAEQAKLLAAYLAVGSFKFDIHSCSSRHIYVIPQNNY